MTPEQEIARGQHAQRLLEDPLLQEALATVRTGIREAFYALPSDAPADQLRYLKLMDRAREQFENVLTLLVHGATVANNELREEEHTQARVAAINRRTLNG